MSANRSIAFFDTQFKKQVAGRDFALNPFEKLALPYVHGRVLDIGCGMGNLGIEAARRGASVVAVDASDAAIEHIRHTAAAEKLAIEAVLADIQAHVARQGLAIINVLTEGTTFMGMFEPGNYYLFGQSELEDRFSGWKILHAVHESFAAPENTVKVFSTVVAQKQ